MFYETNPNDKVQSFVEVESVNLNTKGTAKDLIKDIKENKIGTEMIEKFQQDHILRLNKL